MDICLRLIKSGNSGATHIGTTTATPFVSSMSSVMTPRGSAATPGVKAIVWPATPDVASLHNYIFLIIIFLMRENDKKSESNNE